MRGCEGHEGCSRGYREGGGCWGDAILKPHSVTYSSLRLLRFQANVEEDDRWRLFVRDADKAFFETNIYEAFLPEEFHNQVLEEKEAKDEETTESQPEPDAASTDETPKLSQGW